jgi:hypothetical protein
MLLGVGKTFDIVQMSKGSNARERPLHTTVSRPKARVDTTVTNLVSPFGLQLIQLLLGPFLAIVMAATGSTHTSKKQRLEGVDRLHDKASM